MEIRHHRHEANDKVKKEGKAGTVSADDEKRSLDEIQKMTDRFAAGGRHDRQGEGNRQSSRGDGLRERASARGADSRPRASAPVSTTRGRRPS